MIIEVSIIRLECLGMSIDCFKCVFVNSFNISPSPLSTLKNGTFMFHIYLLSTTTLLNKCIFSRILRCAYIYLDEFRESSLPENKLESNDMKYTTKFRKGRLGPEVQPLTLVFTIPGRKGSSCPIIIPSRKSTYILKNN